MKRIERNAEAASIKAAQAMLGAEHFFFGKAPKFPAETSEACFTTQSSTNQHSKPTFG